MTTTLLRTLNLVAATVSTAAAALALFQPQQLSHSAAGAVSPGEVYYARMYAARAIPLGLAAGLAPFVVPGERAGAWVVYGAALVQAVDVVIGAAARDRPMVAGASVATVIHIACAMNAV